jgi:uncharacterized protein with NAD-binding domain and iron-sulfur cluster
MGMGQKGLTRRDVVKQGAAAGATWTLLGPSAAFGRRPAARQRVAVLGGGMAGLTAAHELVERGFDVTVFERTALGGKARSIGVPGSAAGGRRPLPGEHGFRFFPGFYHHVPDTMRRIPFPGNANGVWDNMVAANGDVWLRAGDRPDGGPFGIGPAPASVGSVDGLRRVLLDELGGHDVPPQEVAYFVERLMVFVTSCDERRFGEWEKVSWWDFIKAGQMSPQYQKELAAGLTRDLVAAKEKVASTRTIGHMGEAFVWNILGQGNDGAPDRVLNLPTNEAWIEPWVALLRSKGVRFHVGQEVQTLETSGGRISAARVRDAKGRSRRVEADWFVLATPVERARKILGPQVRALDPAFELLDDLNVDWMTGIQFYLNKPADITNGHITFLDSPWALTALTQAQFWGRRNFARDYGDGTAVDCLSVDVSDWDTPGILFKKPAKLCTHDEIAKEVWAQIKAHHTAGDKLPDGILHSYFIDPGMRWEPRLKRNHNETPLLVNTVNTWDKRPKSHTKVPNLFLGGDYVQTDVDLATMEGANESGRTATAALLEASGSKEKPPQMWKLYKPPFLEPVWAADAQLYANGRPNALDVG